MHEQSLRQFHDVIQFRKGHFRLHHPEFHQVPAGLGLLSTERGSKAIHPAQGRRGGFTVELPALRQIGLLVEVVRLEEGGRPFTGVRGEDRGIHQDEAPVVEKVPAGTDDFVTNSQDGMLPAGTEPEMPVLHEEPDPVLLRLNGKAFSQMKQLNLRHLELAAPLCPCVRLDGARQDQRGLLTHTCRESELLVPDRRFADHGLDVPGPVPHGEKLNLAAGPASPQPAAERDDLTDVAREVLDVNWRHVGGLVARRFRLSNLGKA